MTVVRVVQMSLDQVIDVVAMRHRGVTAAIAVLVVAAVPPATVSRRAPVRVGLVHRDPMLVHLIAVRVVKVTVVQVVDVAVVSHRGVSAAVTVAMGVSRMGVAAHGPSSEKMDVGCPTLGVRTSGAFVKKGFRSDELRGQ